MKMDRPFFINKSTTAMVGAMCAAWSSSNMCFLAFSMDLGQQQDRAVIASFQMAGSSDCMETITNSYSKVRRVALYWGVMLGSCRVATYNLRH